MFTRPPRPNAGFTIVETLVVLAIAGLILLIVFEAIPALQRSGRNNQRKQDVSIVLQAVSNYELNNSGDFPTTNDLQNFLNNYEKSKLSYYSPTEVTSVNQPATSVVSPIPGQSSSDSVVVYDHAKCDASSDGGATNAGAAYTDVVGLYALESSGSAVTAQCQQL
jgi:prepilin-type N-terminal cleavage/methylation domain-containing protein